MPKEDACEARAPCPQRTLGPRRDSLRPSSDPPHRGYRPARLWEPGIAKAPGGFSATRYGGCGPVQKAPFQRRADRHRNRQSRCLGRASQRAAPVRAAPSRQRHASSHQGSPLWRARSWKPTDRALSVACRRAALLAASNAHETGRAASMLHRAELGWGGAGRSRPVRTGRARFAAGSRFERDGSTGAEGTSAEPRPLCGPRTRPACLPPAPAALACQLVDTTAGRACLPTPQHRRPVHNLDLTHRMCS